MSGAPETTTGMAPGTGRALLLAPTVEKAAAIGVAFDHAVSATPEDLAAVLAREGDTVACAALTGLPTRGGRLAAAVEAVLAACPPQVEVLLDVGDPVGWSVVQQPDAALRGLELVDRAELEGVSFLRFRRAAEPGSLPDLAGVRAELPPPLGTADRLARAVDAVLGPAQAADLRATVDRLQAELTAAHEALAAAVTSPAGQAAAADARGRTDAVRDRLVARGPKALADSRVRRLAVRAGAGAAGLLAVAGVAAQVADRTDTGPEGALLTALLLVSPAPVLYVRRSHGRLAAAIARLTKTVDAAARSAAVAGPDKAQTQIIETLAELAERVEELQRHMAVVTATTVDTAHGLARISATVSGGV